MVADTLHAEPWKQICLSGLDIESITIHCNIHGYSYQFSRCAVELCLHGCLKQKFRFIHIPKNYP